MMKRLTRSAFLDVDGMGMECSVRIPRSWATCDYEVEKGPRGVGFDLVYDACSSRGIRLSQTYERAQSDMRSAFSTTSTCKRTSKVSHTFSEEGSNPGARYTSAVGTDDIVATGGVLFSVCFT